MIDKCNIKSRVMNNQFTALNKLQKRLPHLVKPGLVHQELSGDAVYFQRAVIDVALRIDILVIVPTCQFSPDYLDTPDRLTIYRDFLEYAAEQQNYWHALPHQVASHARSLMGERATS